MANSLSGPSFLFSFFFPFFFCRFGGSPPRTLPPLDAKTFGSSESDMASLAPQSNGYFSPLGGETQTRTGRKLFDARNNCCRHQLVGPLGPHLSLRPTTCVTRRVEDSKKDLNFSTLHFTPVVFPRKFRHLLTSSEFFTHSSPSDRRSPSFADSRVISQPFMPDVHNSFNHCSNGKIEMTNESPAPSVRKGIF